MANLCSGCQEKFYSVAAHETHRVGSYGEPIYQQSPTGKSAKITGYTPSERHCLTADEMRTLDMTQDDKGIWHNPAGNFEWANRQEEGPIEVTS